MKILVLTKIKLQLYINKRIHTTEEYLENEHFFEGWARGFRENGHDIILDGRSHFFIPTGFAYRFPKTFYYLKAFFHVTGFILVDRWFLSRSIEKRVKQEGIDFIFTEINDFLTVASIERMKKAGVSVTEWFGVFPDMVPKRILRTLNHYSHIWCPGDIEAEFRKHGVTNPNIHYIGFSYNEKFMHPDFDKEYAHDICFVGGIGKHHSNRIKILEAVAQRFDDFVFYGYGIEHTAPDSILRQRFKGWADHETLRKLFSSSKIALNLTLDGYDRVKRGINVRSFEIPACRGAVQISAVVKDLKEYFRDDEIVFFESLDDLISKIVFFLRNEDKRKDCAGRAYKRVQNYRHSTNVQKLVEFVMTSRHLQ